jgi:hypothetical protein
VIAGFLLKPDPSVDAGLSEAFRQGGIEQKVIDAQPTISFGVLAKIFPERVDPLVAEHLPQ